MSPVAFRVCHLGVRVLNVCNLVTSNLATNQNYEGASKDWTEERCKGDVL
jgi:hypothetical protein